MSDSQAHDPARKRRGFAPRKRRGFAPKRHITVPRMETVLDQERAIFDGAALVGDVNMSYAAIKKTLKTVAPLLWHADYTRVLQEEFCELTQMGVLQGVVASKACAPPSTYAQRRLHKNLEKRRELEIAQIRNIAAASVRQANQQVYPFSVCARSVAMLMRSDSQKCDDF